MCRVCVLCVWRVSVCTACVWSVCRTRSVTRARTRLQRRLPVPVDAAAGQALRFVDDVAHERHALDKDLRSRVTCACIVEALCVYAEPRHGRGVQAHIMCARVGARAHTHTKHSTRALASIGW